MPEANTILEVNFTSIKKSNGCNSHCSASCQHLKKKNKWLRHAIGDGGMKPGDQGCKRTWGERGGRHPGFDKERVRKIGIDSRLWS